MLIHFFRLAVGLALAAGLTAAPALAAPAALNNPLDTTAVSVTSTATKLRASATPGRPQVGVFLNPTDGDIYVGGPSVTTSTGFFLPSGTIMFVEWTTGDRWYAIRAAAANVNVRIVPVY